MKLKVVNNFMGKMKVEIYTTTGDKVSATTFEKDAATGIFDFPVAKIAAGTYMVKIWYGKTTEIKKVVVN